MVQGGVETEPRAAEVGAGTQVVGGGAGVHVVVGRVELDDGAQGDLEVSVGAGEGRAAVREADLRRGRLGGGLGGAHVLQAAGHLGLQIADLGGKLLHLRLQLLQLGLTRVDRRGRRRAIGRRGGDGRVLRVNGPGRQQAERAHGDTRQPALTDQKIP